MPYRKSWNKLWRGFRRVCTLPLIVLVKFYQRCILREDKKAKRTLKCLPTRKKWAFFAAREEIPQPLMHHIFTAIHQMQQLRWGKLAGM